MQRKTSALALLLGLILVAQAAAFVLFHNQPGGTKLAVADAASVQPPWEYHGWKGWQPPPPPPTTIPPKPQTQTHPTPKAKAHYVLLGANTGDFASCVRQHESSNNYAYSGYYHGAYNMTLQHWDNYGGYSSPESAPPAAQDAKFQDDVNHGSAYMHQQYPVTSRICGM